jgi:hypothetical protein
LVEARRTQAEASLLIALRRLIVRHGAWSGRAEEVESSGSRRRFRSTGEFIESELGSQRDLRRLADVARVTRFRVIGDFATAIDLTPAIRASRGMTPGMFRRGG